MNKGLTLVKLNLFLFSHFVIARNEANTLSLKGFDSAQPDKRCVLLSGVEGHLATKNSPPNRNHTSIIKVQFRIIHFRNCNHT